MQIRHGIRAQTDLQVPFFCCYVVSGKFAAEAPHACASAGMQRSATHSRWTCTPFMLMRLYMRLRGPLRLFPPSNVSRFCVCVRTCVVHTTCILLQADLQPGVLFSLLTSGRWTFFKRALRACLLMVLCVILLDPLSSCFPYVSENEHKKCGLGHDSNMWFSQAPGL